MKDTFFLVFDKGGVARMTKRSPSLGRQEIAVQISVTIPSEAFQSPILKAELDVPECHVLQPTITLEAVEPSPDFETESICQ